MNLLLSTAGAGMLTAFMVSSAQATLIDFDDSSAPKRFSSAAALTTKYSDLGVIFSAEPGPNPGTPAVKILNKNAGFGIAPRSGNNFLTYSKSTTGAAVLTFLENVTNFSIWAGAAQSSSKVTVSYYGATGNLLDTSQFSIYPGKYHEFTYDLPVSSVTITGNEAFVMDDLSFTAAPEPASWAMMITGLGLCAGIRRRRHRMVAASAKAG